MAFDPSNIPKGSDNAPGSGGGGGGGANVWWGNTPGPANPTQADAKGGTAYSSGVVNQSTLFTQGWFNTLRTQGTITLGENSVHFGPDRYMKDGNGQYVHDARGHRISMNIITYNDIVGAMLGTGLIKKNNFSAAKAGWGKLITLAKQNTAAGNTQSPLDVLMNMRNGTGASLSPGGAGSSGSGARSHDYTSVNTQVSLTDKATAHRLIDQVVTQYLGRQATPLEIATFTSTLNTEERTHPSKSVTHTHQSASGSSTSSTTQSGGVGSGAAEQMAIDKAKADKDYAEYQSATTYFNAFVNAAQSPVRV